ncbi:MAG: type I DNA topoisomerase, partial [bacterium]|nr:type I DNA topoisomerase [bacterium]
ENKYDRITFHEITPEAIIEALNNPRKIIKELVDAQYARRILDRVVGYELSPYLWSKLKRNWLSAGRVQSVALRLIVEREQEIRNFKIEKYLVFYIKFKGIKAKLVKLNGKDVGKIELNLLKEFLDKLNSCNYYVSDVVVTPSNKAPLPPFTTSTLTQTAFNTLKFSTAKTMKIAQRLYEGVKINNRLTGLITYMRTDSVNVSILAVNSLRKFIESTYGIDKLSNFVRKFRSKIKHAQEAHEAIRPTYVKNTPDAIKDYLTQDEFKLYDLIWRRFVATQMRDVEFDNYEVIIKSTDGVYEFKYECKVLKNSGFMDVYKIDEEFVSEPKVKKGEKVEDFKIDYKIEETKPPPRYTESSLIKTLESYGIGRPSTYAPIISTLYKRGYVKPKYYLYLTKLGEEVVKILLEKFPQVIDYKFTAEMEEELDKVAKGQLHWKDVVRKFYEPIKKQLG